MLNPGIAGPHWSKELVKWKVIPWSNLAIMLPDFLSVIWADFEEFRNCVYWVLNRDNLENYPKKFTGWSSMMTPSPEDCAWILRNQLKYAGIRDDTVKIRGPKGSTWKMFVADYNPILESFLRDWSLKQSKKRAKVLMIKAPRHTHSPKRDFAYIRIPHR